MIIVRSSDATLLVRTQTALGLFRALRGAELTGVTGLSPARESVMVRFDPRLLDHRQVEEWVRGAKLEEGSGRGRLVEILTLYIGEDLEEVARGCGLTTSEVVEIHAGTVYEAWFLGFVPGFAYLGEVDERIAVGRRASPRREVPAGSVAIAGRQTGVYPRATPGGWNLIGRTEEVMFDSLTGQSRIEPGDRVRFVPL